MEMFSWFDILSIFLILLFGIKGLSSGFIKEVFGLVGVIGGIFLATRFAEGFGTFVNEHTFKLENNASLYLIGFISLLLLFWAICVAIGFILSKLVSFTTASILNKFLGFLVGCIKVFLVFSVLITALSYIDFIKNNLFEKQIKNSFMQDAFLKTGNFIINIDYSKVNEDVKDLINEQEEKFNGNENSQTEVIENDETSLDDDDEIEINKTNTQE